MPSDFTQQLLQRKAYRVRKSHPRDKPAEARSLLDMLLRHLESKCGRGVDSGKREPGT